MSAAGRCLSWSLQTVRDLIVAAAGTKAGTLARLSGGCCRVCAEQIRAASAASRGVLLFGHAAGSSCASKETAKHRKGWELL